MINALVPYLDPLPLIAVLRGITPEEIPAVGAALVANDFRILEVPLNSPRPFESIAALAQTFGDCCLVGAGTVTAVDEVEEVGAAGGQLIVMPHGDRAVIGAAKSAGLLCMPGVMTPTEAFAALDAGADALKLFPGELISPAGVKAMRAVLPKASRLFAVGGVTAETMAGYVRAGANGFGLGTSLYTRGTSADEVRERARRVVAAWRTIVAA